MRCRITIKRDIQVTKAEMKQLEKLHYKWGFMWGYFTRDMGENIVLLAKQGSLILGWALLVDSSYKGAPIKDIHLFVHKDYRRMGIGTRLFSRAWKRYGELQYYPHNTANRRFFKEAQKNICNT
jgi:GNAT superfamily N-acetyltransferase